MTACLQRDVGRDLARSKTRRGRIALHLRCIGRALAGIMRELWPRTTIRALRKLFHERPGTHC